MVATPDPAPGKGGSASSSLLEGKNHIAGAGRSFRSWMHDIYVIIYLYVYIYIAISIYIY